MPRRDPQLFAEFVGARSASLHRTAYLLVGDPHLAQDLVQEALVKSYVAWPRLRDPAKAEAYVRQVITRTAISWFRRRSWSAERPSEHLPTVEVVGHAESTTDRAFLWQGLQQLPPRQRAAIVLRYYDDLTEAQTAELMGCAVGTVKSQVSAGLARLRRVLEDQPALTAPHEHPRPSTRTEPWRP